MLHKCGHTNAGIATHACTDIEAVKNDLFEAQDQGAIEDILEKHSDNFDEDSFSLEDKLPLIDECFKVPVLLGPLTS